MALDNKLGIESSADLAREEERISKKKALALFENDLLSKLDAGKFSALRAIHKSHPPENAISNLSRLTGHTPYTTGGFYYILSHLILFHIS